MYIYHIFLIQSSINGHLGFCHVLAIVSSAILYDITYIWNQIYGTNDLSTEKKIIDLENRSVVAEREQEGEGMGWTGNLGLIDANYCLWNG